MFVLDAQCQGKVVFAALWRFAGAFFLVLVNAGDQITKRVNTGFKANKTLRKHPFKEVHCVRSFLLFQGSVKTKVTIFQCWDLMSHNETEPP